MKRNLEMFIESIGQNGRQSSCTYLPVRGDRSSAAITKMLTTTIGTKAIGMAIALKMKTYARHTYADQKTLRAELVSVKGYFLLKPRPIIFMTAHESNRLHEMRAKVLA